MSVLQQALLNSTPPAVLLTAVVWLALRLAPRTVLNAATRYVIWWIALICTVVMPIFFVQLPRVVVSTPVPAPMVSYSAPAVMISPRMEPAPRSAPVISFPVEIVSWKLPVAVVLIWPVLSAFLLLRLLVSCVQLARLKRRAHSIDATARIAEWTTRCGGERAGIRLSISDEIASPMATGPREPAILIPQNLFEQLSADDLDRIGLHETAHLLRRDDYTLLAQRVLEALFPLHPLVLWIGQRINLEREIACDDLVIATTGQPRSYAECLTRVIENCAGKTSAWPAAAAVEDKSHLAQRIDALLDKAKRAGAHLMRTRLATTGAVLLALAFVAAHAPSLIAFVTLHTLTRTIAPVHESILLIPQVTGEVPANGDLSGRVLEDSTGNPIASAEVRFRQTGKRELSADLDTDRAGHFGTSGLAPGDYEVDIQKPNYVNTSFRLHLPSASLTLRLVRYGVIDGLATDDSGRPLPGRIMAPGGRTVGSGRVTVLIKSPESGDLGVVRDAELQDGRYRFFDLPPGEYAVGLWYAGLGAGSGMQLYPNTAHPRFFTVTGGEVYKEVNFIVTPRPAVSVAGRVSLPDGVKGEFQLALGLPEQPLLPIAQVMSTADGTFRFEKVPAGTYDLMAAGPTGGYGAFDSTLKKGNALFGHIRIQVAGQNLDNVALPVAEARSINVVLRAHTAPIEKAPDGCPATASVAFQPLEPWAIMYLESAQASFDKEQKVLNLAPGRFRATASGLGDGCYQVNPPIVDLSRDAAGPLVVEVASAGSIHGTVRAGAPGSVVVLTDPQATSGAQARAAFTDANGHFEFAGLRPARYRIAAYPASEGARARWISGQSGGVEIDVAGGAPTAVELTLSVKGPQ